MNELARTSTKAILSLVFGLLGIMCCACFTGIPAVFCGHLALDDIRRSEGALVGKGMAIVGLITGYLSIVIALGISVFLMVTASPTLNFQHISHKHACQSGQKTINDAVEDWAEAGDHVVGEPVDKDEIINALPGFSPPICPVNNMPIGIPDTVGSRPECPDPSVRKEHEVSWDQYKRQ